MTLRSISVRLPRRPSLEETQEERTRHQEKVETELARRSAEIADHVPGSRHDEITFRARGDGEEVRLKNPYDFTPTRFEVVDIAYPYVVGRSRKSLSNGTSIFLKTSAPQGESITVRFW